MKTVGLYRHSLESFWDAVPLLTPKSTNQAMSKEGNQIAWQSTETQRPKRRVS